MIPYGKQSIDQDDIDSVVRVLKSSFLTQGPQVEIFENYVAKYCNAKFGIAINSATSALHIACLALGLKKGDWLWTSPNSFVASANCAIYCSAKVDFVDIDDRTYNMSAKKLEKKLVDAKENGTLPKIVIPVHFAGQSSDMKSIYKLSKKYGFKIIEDASHAIGGSYLDKKIGSCKFSDITVFSFHPVKIVTSGEGGVATTNSPDLYEKMNLLRNHGITRNANLMSKRKDINCYYEQIELGFNYRITDIQAALGTSQMAKLDEFVSKRHALQKRYNSIFSNPRIIYPHQSNQSYSALHLYPIQIKFEEHSNIRDLICKELRSAGIGVNIHYIPIHTQPFYQKFGFKSGDFPVAESYYSNCMSLPLFSSMTLIEQDKVVETLENILHKNNLND